MRLRRDSEDGQPAAPDQCSHSDVASRAPLPAAPGHQVIHSIEWRPRHLMTEVSQAGLSPYARQHFAILDRGPQTLDVQFEDAPIPSYEEWKAHHERG
jgi:hypothetical protein